MCHRNLSPRTERLIDTVSGYFFFPPFDRHHLGLNGRAEGLDFKVKFEVKPKTALLSIRTSDGESDTGVG